MLSSFRAIKILEAGIFFFLHWYLLFSNQTTWNGFFSICLEMEFGLQRGVLPYYLSWVDIKLLKILLCYLINIFKFFYSTHLLTIFQIFLFFQTWNGISLQRGKIHTHQPLYLQSRSWTQLTLVYLIAMYQILVNANPQTEDSPPV